MQEEENNVIANLSASNVQWVQGNKQSMILVITTRECNTEKSRLEKDRSW